MILPSITTYHPGRNNLKDFYAQMEFYLKSTITEKDFKISPKRDKSLEDTLFKAQILRY